MSPNTWTRATLGDAVRAGDPIIVYCNSMMCSYLSEQGSQYRAKLTVADLKAFAERYGDDVLFVEFRKHLRCRHCGSGDVSTIVDSRYETPAERWNREMP